MSQNKVYVITGGSGGMGIATAKRLVNQGILLLADISEERLDEVKKELESEGATVQTMVVDITSKAQVQALADKSRSLGRLGAIIHTAGLSPALAPADKIMEVNTIGTALILDSFQELAEQGSVALCVSSMAGHNAIADSEIDKVLDEPLADDFTQRINEIIQDDRLKSYGLSKRAVLRMVEQRVNDWGRKGARIVSVSPGLINTPMGKAESKDPSTDQMMRKMNPLNRYGEPSEIASVITFLISSDASYISGTDLLVDGGVTTVIKGKARS